MGRLAAPLARRLRILHQRLIFKSPPTSGVNSVSIQRRFCLSTSHRCFTCRRSGTSSNRNDPQIGGQRSRCATSLPPAHQRPNRSAFAIRIWVAIYLNADLPPPVVSLFHPYASPPPKEDLAHPPKAKTTGGQTPHSMLRSTGPVVQSARHACLRNRFLQVQILPGSF
jgi:hypothetical protein